MIKWCSLILFLFSSAAWGAPISEFSIPAMTVTTAGGSSETMSVSLQIVILMTVLTLIPAVVLTMTSFTRVIIVFSILRQAIGMPTTPSNQILVGLALFLSFFIMSPVIMKINESSIIPYMNNDITIVEALERAENPIRQFMIHQIREKDLEVFRELGNSESSVESISLAILIPAFVTSELKTAFQIGFLLFIPFLIIDLVVASVLMAMGMMMLSPLIISLPFKIMLFVLVDGWTLVVGTLTHSFGG